jgi:hypothetical protein
MSEQKPTWADLGEPQPKMMMASILAIIMFLNNLFPDSQQMIMEATDSILDSMEQVNEENNEAPTE